MFHVLNVEHQLNQKRQKMKLKIGNFEFEGSVEEMKEFILNSQQKEQNREKDNLDLEEREVIDSHDLDKVPADTNNYSKFIDKPIKKSKKTKSKSSGLSHKMLVQEKSK